MIHVEDKSLVLSDGRILAYADDGNTSSSSLVLFFHGAFSIGDASRLPHALSERNVHFVAPSLPGWGRSSPMSTRSSYAATLASDIMALIVHLHPRTYHKLHVYLCGHAFGTVPAQILYGLDRAAFPLVNQLAALVLLAPHSPPKYHADYARCMTWSNYFMTGPPARYIPFSLIMRILRFVTSSFFVSEARAQEYMRRHVLKLESTNEQEQEVFLQWREEYGINEGQFERELGRNAYRSVIHSWRGFLDMPAVYHSNWGHFSSPSVEADCPVLLVSSESDDMAPAAMAQWLANSYKYAKLKSISGNNSFLFFYLDDIWNEVFEMENRFGS